MSSTLVPPPDTERPKAEDAVSADFRPILSARREDSYRRALPWAMGVSLVVHLLLIFMASRFLYLAVVALPEGIEVVDVPSPQPLEPLSEPDRPEIRPGEQEVIEVVPGEPEEGGAEPEPELRRMTNAERLRPRIGDPRLWLPYPDEPYPAHVADAYARADSAIRAVLRTWLDSLDLSEEERRRATEWTFGEGDKKWGISEKGLHLGDITIPIPFGALFGQSMSPNAQKTRQMIKEFNEIRQQDIETDIRKEREEALKEMRKRTEDEVERRRRDTTPASPGDSAAG
jgi:hypothetical protein